MNSFASDIPVLRNHEILSSFPGLLIGAFTQKSLSHIFETERNLNRICCFHKNVLPLTISPLISVSDIMVRTAWNHTLHWRALLVRFDHNVSSSACSSLCFSFAGAAIPSDCVFLSFISSFPVVKSWYNFWIKSVLDSGSSFLNLNECCSWEPNSSYASLFSVCISNTPGIKNTLFSVPILSGVGEVMLTHLDIRCAGGYLLMAPGKRVTG